MTTELQTPVVGESSAESVPYAGFRIRRKSDVGGKKLGAYVEMGVPGEQHLSLSQSRPVTDTIVIQVGDVSTEVKADYFFICIAGLMDAPFKYLWKTLIEEDSPEGYRAARKKAAEMLREYGIMTNRNKD